MVKIGQSRPKFRALRAKRDLAWKKYTTASCGGCDKYRQCCYFPTTCAQSSSPRDPVGNRLLAWKTLPWVESKASHPLSDAPMKCARLMDHDYFIGINKFKTTDKELFCAPMTHNPLAIFASTTTLLAAHSHTWYLSFFLHRQIFGE